MRLISNKTAILTLAAMLAAPATSSLSAQEQLPAAQQDQQAMQGNQAADNSQINVWGNVPTDLSGMADGPKIDGVITARKGNRMQVTTSDGTATMIAISSATQIKSSGGFLGLNSNKLASDSLLAGLPVTVETKQWGNNLVAADVDMKNKDLRTAEMIHNGTNQRFSEQGAAIEQNAAATEALRGRVGDIDKYNIKSTTNVNFDTGKYKLSNEDKAKLCQTATQAESTDNALLLVVGYTDSTGSQEVNQRLSEKRAAGVVNYLQQACGWKPWRMLTPTGMATADPLADNSTPEGKAQNRRVAVNILVSKSVDGMQ
ncbi:OmpA family protein [Porphyrobacter algicida]|uniref:OmpA family protein n=1 Tax=Qipengyuania algicida TaxID=1836209 RepID=A0A845AE64_9SPHN|nr:OmpA family protein [Qipengyuania algicida]MXP27513.1 OmpA family protein [Qipengyuania algicida]